jgi:pimeloyl-ACP methyl ester carboxylesterase
MTASAPPAPGAELGDRSPSAAIGPLVVDDSGVEDGRPPIVLLHGLTFDRRIWSPIIDALRAMDPDRRVLAVDLPGHGASPSRLPHDVEHIVELVRETLSAMRATTPVLVGHSMSGAIVTLYAGRDPIAGVVNVDQPLEIADFARLVGSLEPRLRGPDFAELWPMFFDSFHTELLLLAMRQLVEDNCQPRQDIVLSYWQQLLDQPVNEVEAMIEATLSDLTAISTPYTLVVGHPLPAAARQWMDQHLPDARVLTWDDTGHFPHLAHPAEFATLIAEIGTGVA